MSFYIHDIDPVIFSLGGIDIRWYGLAYVVGLLCVWFYGKKLAKKAQISGLTPAHFDDFIVWATLGVVFGGRIGDILFYHPRDLWKVWEYFYIWEPGRSFHGGLLGAAMVTFLFCKKHHIPLRPFADILSLTAPIGLFLGRLSNFINGELWGRESNVPWAVVFPEAGLVPRHPSQLYEAFTEGLLLFLILYGINRTSIPQQKPGFITGIFFVGYGVARIVMECFREPDTHIGYFWNVFTWGQMLSIPLLLGGGYFILTAHKKG